MATYATHSQLAELYPFGIPLLQFFVFACQSTAPVHYAPHFVDYVAPFMDELHWLLLFGVYNRYLVQREDSPLGQMTLFEDGLDII